MVNTSRGHAMGDFERGFETADGFLEGEPRGDILRTHDGRRQVYLKLSVEGRLT